MIRTYYRYLRLALHRHLVRSMQERERRKERARNERLQRMTRIDHRPPDHFDLAKKQRF